MTLLVAAKFSQEEEENIAGMVGEYTEQRIHNSISFQFDFSRFVK